MFKNILVCLDGSAIAEQIIPYAIEEALAFKSRVVLIQVFNIPGILTPDIPGFPGVPVHTEAMLEQLRRDEAKAKAYLKGVTQAFHDKGIRVKGVTLEGLAGPTIVNYADENKINLIAISSHGHSGLRNILFGSVAEFILRESKVPILLVRPKNP